VNGADLLLGRAQGFPRRRRRKVLKRPRVSCRWRALLTAAVLGLGGAGCGSFTATAHHSGAVAAHSRDCPNQQLTCEQLVSLGFAYPYARQPTSYLYVNGVAYPYVALEHQPLADATVRAGDSVLSARQLLDHLGIADQADEPRTPVIAYGSNANVEALNRKFLSPAFPGDVAIPVVRATLEGFDVAWSPELVFNGAMPATIGGSTRTRVEVWITWLNAAQLKRMNDTEGAGVLYSFGYIRDARLVTPGPDVAQPWVYVDCFGAVRVDGQILGIRGVPARHRRFLAVDSAGALARVAPALGWSGSVFDLLLDNVRSPEKKADRTKTLKRLGVQLPEPGYVPVHACASK
jgi:hypothetical protein